MQIFVDWQRSSCNSGPKDEYPILLAILSLLYFLVNFKISLLVSSKEPTEILIEIESVDKFEDYWHFNNIVRIHEHGCLPIHLGLL